MLPGNCAISTCSDFYIYCLLNVTDVYMYCLLNATDVYMYCLFNVTDAAAICVTKRLMICTSQQIPFECSKGMRRTGRAAIMEENRVHMEFWLGNLKERDNWKELGMGVKIILK